MSDLLNFGFDPTGVALGSEGSPSMPGNPMTGLEHPMDANMAAFDDFVMQTQRRYGDVSDPGGTIYDPRGERALSAKPADYKDTDMMRPDEIALHLSDSHDQLFGGDPILAPFTTDSSGLAQSLYGMDIGLSAQGAASLADSLVTYDPKILEGIKIPRTVEPRVTNELGLAGQYGGLPEAFFDPGTGVMKQGVPETVDRVIAQSAQYQHVDENGIVHKYSPGTSPYDAIAEGRMAGLSGSVPGTGAGYGETPAQIRKFGGSLRQSLTSGGSSNLSSANQSGNAARQSLSQSAPTLAPTGGQETSTGAGAGFGVSTGAGAGTGTGTGDGVADGGYPSYTGGAGSGSYSADGGGYSGEDSYYTTSEVVPEDKKPCSKWWWLLLLIPVGGGIYYATRKKKGKRR